MYKTCKTEQSAARQRQLEQYLLKEMLVKHFDDISISDLCDGLNIPRKAFYRYFSGKQGAFHALIDHTLIDFDSQTLGASRSRSIGRMKFLEIYFRFWKEQKALLDAMERSNLWEDLMRYTVDYAQNALDSTKPNMPQEQRDENAYITRFTVYGTTAVLQSWYRRGFPESEAYMASITAKHLEKALNYWNT